MIGAIVIAAVSFVDDVMCGFAEWLERRRKEREPSEALKREQRFAAMQEESRQAMNETLRTK